jgi:hypothetical protein
MIRVNLYEQLAGQRRSMPRWASWLTMAASLVFGVTLFLLAASLALILIPIVLAVGAIAAWRLKSRLKAAGFGQSDPFARARPGEARVDVIDAEYRVIEPGEPPRR